MCGLLIVAARPGTFHQDEVEQALGRLVHRGPDAAGLELERIGDWEVWLGHQRLAIQDLDSRANQPMRIDESAIVYNGEVYNATELRGRLNRHHWRSSSDTEVLLATLHEHGPSSLRNVNGMFAFAYLNGRERTLTLARDRMGQKPLYLYRTPQCLVAASELKAIYRLLSGKRILTPDARALAHYRWLGYLPFSYTPYREIQKFRASNWVTYELMEETIECRERSCFWDPFARLDKRAFRSVEEARENCSTLLDEATAIRTVSDRPIGIFLSAGIDSTLIASSLARAGADATAITIRSAGFDESQDAENTARILGLPYRRIELHDDSYAAQLGLIEETFDEPFADQSAIPLMALCQEAVGYVTVALTGDGGDEPFVGYPWLAFPQRIWGNPAVTAVRNARSSAVVRTVLSSFIRSSAGEKAIQFLERAVGRNPKTARAKAFVVDELLRAQSPGDLYDVLQAAQPPASLSRRDASLLQRPLLEAAQSFYPEYSWGALAGRSLTEQLAALDLVTYLPDGVLVKADRSSMAYSMELRSPFLDHRLIEFGLSLPLHYKVSGTQHKLILRELLRTRLDAPIVDRSKTGFGVSLPAELPDAPTERGRWVKHCERVWAGRWA